MNLRELTQGQIVLFDGICNLCTGSVIFILQNEKRPTFLFAALQSEAGKVLLEQGGLPAGYDQAVVLIDQERVYSGSTAALKIGQQLKFPWSFLAQIGLMVPRFLRDWVYRHIAQHRYEWFGKRDVCIVPTESLKARFIET